MKGPIIEAITGLLYRIETGQIPFWTGSPIRQSGFQIGIVQTSKFVSALAGLGIAAFAWAQDSGVDSARQLFARYAELENAHDPAVADLYADEAFIKTRRSMPMGDPQEITVPAAKHKMLLRQNMAVAKARGERSAYSDVTYTVEGNFVRIGALRSSHPKKDAAPISLLVGPSPGGKWLIYEELSESRQ